MTLARIRNFSIVAHIDHGKSTLADRLLSLTGTMDAKKAVDQVLDSMDLERERGITIKAHTVRLLYKARDGQEYTLNLIDTPGHVDFSYEVSRSLAACEGAVLIVDAAQGVEAQTLANVYVALDNNLEIVPVLNKIDLPVARPDWVKQQIEDTIGLDASNALLVSAKTGLGVHDMLEAVVERIPPPLADRDAPLSALIFDSWYDTFRGVVVLVRVMSGVLKKGQKLQFWATNQVYECTMTAVRRPAPFEVEAIEAGQVGIVAASIKDIAHARVGDTVTDADNPAAEPLPGFKSVKPMVFAGLFPVDAADYQDLKDALGKLVLNDASVTYEPETSAALGFGFRTGFLGLLHMEIIQERLEREFALELITTAPGVRYKIYKTDGTMIEVDNPSRWPDPSEISKIEEPVILATILTNEEYVGGILKLVEDKRGKQKTFEYVSSSRVMLHYELPLNEIVVDFYDRLKSVSRGYASMDYEMVGYRPAELVKLDVRINDDVVDAMSMIVHRDKAYYRGRELVQRMRELIPRQLFEVVIQAAVGSRIIARESVKPLRKNVTAKCYGGDITRKRKLLERQKEGKKRMKQVGKVEIPQEAFLAALKV